MVDALVLQAPVAQPVEQRTENPCVGGSSPPWGTIGVYAPFFWGLSPPDFTDTSKILVAIRLQLSGGSY